MKFDFAFIVSVSENETIEHAKSYFKKAGYKIDPSLPMVFRRGSIIGNLFSFSPRNLQTKIVLSIQALSKDDTKVELTVDVNTTGILLTDTNREFWNAEIEGIKKAIQTGQVDFNISRLSEKKAISKGRKSILILIIITFSISTLIGILAMLIIGNNHIDNIGITTFMIITFISLLNGIVGLRRYWEWQDSKQNQEGDDTKPISINKMLPLKKEEVEECVNKLKDLGYFEYVTDQIEAVMSHCVQHYLECHDFSPGSPGYEYDETHRLFFADAESLAEGGISCCIFNNNEVKSFLAKLGVFIKYAEDKVESVNGGNDFRHWVIIDGEKHEIIDTVKDPTFYGWDAAHKRTIEILNKLLKQSGCKERAYGQGRSNDANIIILTQEQYDFLRTIPVHHCWVPFKAEDIIIDIIITEDGTYTETENWYKKLHYSRPESLGTEYLWRY